MNHLFFSLSLLLSTTLSTSNLNNSSPLLAFKSSADSSGHTLSSWTTVTNPCSGSWLGVTCRNSHVIRLVLEGLDLEGSLMPLATLTGLNLLSLKNNSLSSPLHRLDMSPWRPHLKLLYLSQNRFSGPFPAGILLLRRLRRLDLAGNLLSGGIPSDIGLRLPRLLTLRLEGNLFTGAVPASLASVPELNDLNLSANRLTGSIPAGHFSASSFADNPGLCGAPLQVRCTNGSASASSTMSPISLVFKRNNTERSTVVAVAVAGTAAVLAIAVLVSISLLCCRRRRKRKREIGGRDGGKEEGRRRRVVVFEGCEEFEVEELMRGAAEMLGRGTVGTTYRVVMEGGDPERGVVVKRVRREKMVAATSNKERVGGGDGGGEEEERLLGEIGGWRHPNVVSLRAYYSTEEELLLVFDYLPNGSLHSLLHGNRGPGRIPVDWPTRLKLAHDAAKGLAFLHGASKLTHQNLTSSNILLKDDGNACISDFALHQFRPPPIPPSSSTDLSSDHLNASSNRTITTHKCDIYSFGVILLEILTGRLAGDEDLEAAELARWVQTVVREEWTSEVFDMELLAYREMEDEMVALLQVALLCVAPERRDRPRPRMSVVSKMIEDIRDRGSRRVRGGGSHYSYETSSFPCLSEDTPAFTTST